MNQKWLPIVCALLSPAVRLQRFQTSYWFYDFTYDLAREMARGNKLWWRVNSTGFWQARGQLTQRDRNIAIRRGRHVYKLIGPFIRSFMRSEERAKGQGEAMKELCNMLQVFRLPLYGNIRPDPRQHSRAFAAALDSAMGAEITWQMQLDPKWVAVLGPLRCLVVESWSIRTMLWPSGLRLCGGGILPYERR